MLDNFVYFLHSLFYTVYCKYLFDHYCNGVTASNTIQTVLESTVKTGDIVTDKH